METEFIAWVRRQLDESANVLLGPGDDAAVLRASGDRETVVTTDLLTEGVDFLLAEVSPERVGRKALAVNLSDLAAMAAVPVAAFVAVALPRVGAGDLARQLFAGMHSLARRYDVAIAGGDTNTWTGELVISITAIGQLTEHGPLRRDRAQPSDAILVTGQLGGSRLGKQFDFEPRVREALRLHERYELHAGMDISDGLTLDLARLAAASRCGAVLQLDKIPIDPAAHRFAEICGPERSALDHALSDGEDFELLFTAAPEVARQIMAENPLDIPITCIGHMTREPGLWSLQSDGSLEPLEPAGYQHE